jgi:hypothetical protein
MVTTRSLIRFARPALAAALFAAASPWLARAADVCVDVFRPSTGVKTVCFDCNSISLTAEQERICTLKCDEAEFKYKSMCYRRRPDPEASERAPRARASSSSSSRGSGRTTAAEEEER